MSKAVKSVGSTVKKAAGGAAKGIMSPLGMANPFIGAQLGAAQGAAASMDEAQQLKNLPTIALSSAAQQKARGEDVAIGREFAREVVPAGSLGRLGENENIQAVLSQMSQGLQGMGSQEMQARRDLATEQIGGATETARRRLAAAQARAGVRGATAGAQQSNIISQGIQARAGFERDLMLQNRAAQQTAAQDLLAGQMEVTKFDLSQAARERLAELSTGLGFAQIGSAERAGKAAAGASVAAAQAQRPSGGLMGGILGK